MRTTVLHEAVIANQVQVVKLFLSPKFIKNVCILELVNQKCNGSTPLDIACFYYNEPMVRLLLPYTKDHQSAVFNVLRSGKDPTQMLTILRIIGSADMVVNTQGNIDADQKSFFDDSLAHDSLAHVAAREKVGSVVWAWIKTYIPVIHLTQQNQNRRTPLQIACLKRHPPSVDALLVVPTLTEKDAQGRTMLQLLFMKPLANPKDTIVLEDCALRLIQRIPQNMVKDEINQNCFVDGESVFQRAIRFGCSRAFVHILHLLGGDWIQLNHKNLSALDLAIGGADNNYIKDALSQVGHRLFQVENRLTQVEARLFSAHPLRSPKVDFDVIPQEQQQHMNPGDSLNPLIDLFGRGSNR